MNQKYNRAFIETRQLYIPRQVSMVLVNWNGSAYLETCIQSVREQTYPFITFLVIDNGSEDGSVAWLRQHYPDIALLCLGENVGFAKAHNIGIRQAQGEYYMPINFDLMLRPTFVEALVSILETHPDVGAVTGKLLQMASDGQPTKVIDSTGHRIKKNRAVYNRGTGETDVGQYDREGDVFGVSGTAPLYRRIMLESIKMGDDYYDERYFAYWEDVDLDWRAQHAGWSAWYTPKAVGYHYRRGGRTPGDLAVRLTFRNRYLTLLKNDRLSELIKDARHIVPYELHCWLQMTMNRHYWSLWRMVPSLLQMLPEAWQKRQQIMRSAVERSGPTIRDHYFESAYADLGYRKRLPATRQPAH